MDSGFGGIGDGPFGHSFPCISLTPPGPDGNGKAIGSVLFNYFLPSAPHHIRVQLPVLGEKRGKKGVFAITPTVQKGILGMNIVQKPEQT